MSEGGMTRIYAGNFSLQGAELGAQFISQTLSNVQVI